MISYSPVDHRHGIARTKEAVAHLKQRCRYPPPAPGVEVAQAQFMDRIVDVTVVLQRQVRPIQTVQKAVECSAVPRFQLRGRHGCGQEFKTKSVREALEVSRTWKSSPGPVRVLCFPWVRNVVTVVGRVRDGFSSKPDVAASFLPTVAAVANHFWTLRRPRSRLLRQRRTVDAASFCRILEPSPIRDGERSTIGSMG